MKFENPNSMKMNEIDCCHCCGCRSVCDDDIDQRIASEAIPNALKEGDGTKRR